MPKKSGLHALIGAKCPQCRKGDLFAFPASNVSKFDKMYSHCPHCNLRFEVEPGFFIGAMYVSYVIVVGLMILTGLFFFYVLGNPPNWVYYISFPSIIIVLLPLIFRYSRVFYLHAFGGVSYNDKL